MKTLFKALVIFVTLTGSAFAVDFIPYGQGANSFSNNFSNELNRQNQLEEMRRQNRALEEQARQLREMNERNRQQDFNRQLDRMRRGY